MKFYILILIGFLSNLAVAQVGINTNDPQSDLDVNGSVRVRNLADGNVSSGEAVRLVGVDAQGNLVPVNMGENVEMSGNTVTATKSRLQFGDLPSLIIPSNGRIDNLNLVILPGERNHGKSIIRIEHPSPTPYTGAAAGNPNNIVISGIQAAQDGTQIWLYPTDGSITFLPLDGNSNSDNQVQDNSHVSCRQYEMIRLVYDAVTQKWVIMKHHG